MSKTNRREFLIKNAPLIAAPLLLPMLSDQIVASPVHDLMNRASSLTFAQNKPPEQEQWRYCNKCCVLFFNGAANHGRCPAGGGHEAQGYNFTLPYGNLPETPTAQINWRFCDKCYSMFWDGIADKGRCPAGGGHLALGFLFRLYHDISIDALAQQENSNTSAYAQYYQAGWRYCQKCHAMFYDGYSNKGKCAAGGGHVAQGYPFVLSHAITPDLHLHADVSTNGWAPIGGWVDITANQNGDYVFSGHMHNSGFPNIKYTLGVVLIPSAKGQAWRGDHGARINAPGFAIHAHQVDGTQTLINRKRDDDWRQPGNYGGLRQDWSIGFYEGSSLRWGLVASATITNGIQHFLNDLAGDAMIVGEMFCLGC